MATPPGRTGVDGPILKRVRAIVPARLGAARLGVARLGYVPVDVEVSDGNVFVPQWREKPSPPEYGADYVGTRVIE